MGDGNIKDPIKPLKRVPINNIKAHNKNPV
jgi:hypothetical protein